ncbi:VapC toxin family PIN domain ribonuclease [Candidatus Roizmanbacteria bacterium CG_4_9_14_0_8_um_filter_34_12]|uniref:Ribonuclease VapC n=2 Tax=Candidatus Roizmaniibacteriota TaxID=1752723 RepID=A0A2M7E4I0_9BACT|nr:MAG: VapC toxin family PIN domain ribonuclease [Candidatus Roizmanbacteria bacterium CG01_land_8_20_14_3_00_33_9]PJB87541.1 MAG: VapC toxin family PIN domain ribonuclease [Candidatus Roizmanbacteria bacterium CG_4_9_14_0_8_um_filter_34_12]
MKYLLDTNVLINHLRGKNRIDKTIIKSGVAISIITWAELIYGTYKSVNKEKSLAIIKALIEDLQITILSLNEKVVFQYAELKVELEKTGKILDDFDLLIAATAMTNKITLVTHNTKHFRRISTLKIY